MGRKSRRRNFETESEHGDVMYTDRYEAPKRFYRDYEVEEDILYYQEIEREVTECLEGYGFYNPFQRVASHELYEFLATGDVPEFLLNQVEDDSEDDFGLEL